MRVLAAIAAAGCALLLTAGCGASKHATPPATAPPATTATSSAVPQSLCPSQQGAGIVADFGHRKTLDRAGALLARAESVGFQSLKIQRRGCADYAVVLPGLRNLREGKALQREARAAGLAVALDCRSHPVEGGLAAVFGHRRTRREALALRARAAAQGFQGLEVVEDRCSDWEVDLYGIKTPGERAAFRKEARRAGFRVTFEPG